MFRHLLSLLFMISFTAISSACTFIPTPFCEQLDNGNTILYGKTIDVVDDGIRFQIYDLLTGNETDQIITIFDQAPFDCNGTFYLEALTLLPLDLEVIVSVEQIDSLLNPWDDLGAYRVSEYYTENRRLRVEDGNVIGNITSPFEGDQIVPLSTFVSGVQNGTVDCLILGVEDKYVDDVVASPNPATDQVFLSYSDRSSFRIDQAFVYSQVGSRVELWVTPENSLDVSHLPSGLYVIEVIHYDGLRSRHKIVIAR